MREEAILRWPDAVNVAHTVDRCRVLGPGERFVLWVQGCPLRCPGCHNPQFQPFRHATWFTVDDLEERILAVSGVEGATYVGGEPFAQAQALADLSRRIRAKGLSVMVYSGFKLEQLRRGVLPHARALLAETDLLLDGPYREHLPSNRPWRGSDNQRLIPLTQRYRDKVVEWDRPSGQQFEVHFDAAGGIEILGIPPKELAQPPLPPGSQGGTRNDNTSGNVTQETL